MQLLEADDQGLAEFAWLVGHWAGENQGAQIEEHWTHSAGGTMLGVSRTIVNEQTALFEFLRIEQQPDGIFYLAAPRGRHPPTPFRLTEAPGRDKPWAVFENPDHDFPQRILYWLDDVGCLHGRIEGTQAGVQKYDEWVWHPARLPGN